MYALSEACHELLEEGLQNSFSRHRSVAEECRGGVEELGLKLWPRKREICSNTVTAVEAPECYVDTEIVNTLSVKYGVLIGGGFRELKGQLLRIGHMGYQASIANIFTTLDALKRTLDELKKRQPFTR